MKPSCLLWAVALVLGTQNSYANTHAFSQTIFFGDSLSDTGRLKDIVHQNHPDIGDKLQPAFVTNPDPVWTQVFAQGLGSQADANTTVNPTGNNYAIGGARSSQDIVWNDSHTIASTNQQIKTHLAQKQGKADPAALYAIWIGSNDLNAAAAATSQEAAAAAIATAAQKTYIDIATLAQTGAMHILVPNIPDLGLTPRMIKYGDKAQAQARMAAKLYNDNLYTALNGATANVIPANTFGLLQEVNQNPSNFGFVNTKGEACQMPARNKTADDPASTSLACTPKHLIAKDANETYLFADDIHPAGKTHRILAQYYRSILDAPLAVAKLSDRVLDDGTQAATQLNHRMNALGDKNSWWADLNIAKHDQHPISIEKIAPSFTLGASFASTLGSFGAYAQAREQQFGLDSHSDAKTRQIGTGVFYRFGKELGLGVNVQAGVDRLHIDTHRHIAWDGERRVHTASGTGSRWHMGVQGGFGVDMGRVHYRPYANLHWQATHIHDLVENQAQLATAMRFHGQQKSRLQGGLGVWANYQLSDSTKLVGNLGYVHHFNEQTSPITASLLSIPQYSKGFSLNTPKTNSQQWHALMGVNHRLSGGMLSVGVSAHQGHDKPNASAFLGWQNHF